MNDHRKEIDELHKDLHEKDQHMEDVIDDYEVQIKAQEHTHSEDIKELNSKVENLEQQLKEKEAEFDNERQMMEQKVRAQLERRFSNQETFHKEEVDGLTKEWDMERKVYFISCLSFVYSV